MKPFIVRQIIHSYMFKVSGFIMVACILWSCNAAQNSSPKVLTIKEFTKVYYDTLIKRYPKNSFAIIDDSTIKTGFNGNELSIASDNAYLTYKSNPEAIQEVWNKYIAALDATFNSSNTVDVSKIVPVIKPLSYLDEIKERAHQMGSDKPVESIYEKYNDELIIVYAEDSKTNIRYLMQSDLKALPIPKDSLKPVAIRNLNKLLTNIESKDGKGIYMITAGGDYEASIILLGNILTQQNLPVNGDMVIAIPNRDMLLVTGSNDKDNIDKVKKLAKESYETGSYPLSNYLFKWNGTRFEKYEQYSFKNKS